MNRFGIKGFTDQEIDAIVNDLKLSNPMVMKKLGVQRQPWLDLLESYGMTPASRTEMTRETQRMMFIIKKLEHDLEEIDQIINDRSDTVKGLAERFGCTSHLIRAYLSIRGVDLEEYKNATKHIRKRIGEGIENWRVNNSMSGDGKSLWLLTQRWTKGVSI